MFKVIHMFRDLTDGGHIYCPGDTFPRAGIEATEERLAELSTADNRRGKPLIAEMPEAEITEKPKATRKRVKKDDD